MENKTLAIPTSRLKVGDRVRIATVPNPVKNLTLGAIAFVESEPSIVAGMERVRIRLEDNRVITWNAEYLERLDREANLSKNLEESSQTNRMQTSIRIDPEFEALIPPLSLEEREQLERNLRERGCRDPLVVWKGRNILLDGHNRFEICTEYSIPFRAIEIEFEDRESAIAIVWIIDNQLGRRNLTPETVSYLRGKRYNLEKTIGHGFKQWFSLD